jgi:hypothetical protein
MGSRSEFDSEVSYIQEHILQNAFLLKMPEILGYHKDAVVDRHAGHKIPWLLRGRSMLKEGSIA